MRKQEPLQHLPRLFTTLRDRYLNRPGGYTRVLRIEPMNKHFDQAPSAILELVDGPKDMRFHMTAKTLVRERATEEGIREITAKNVDKVTRYRDRGMEELEKEVKRMEKQARDEEFREVCFINPRISSLTFEWEPIFTLRARANFVAAINRGQDGKLTRRRGKDKGKGNRGLGGRVELTRDVDFSPIAVYIRASSTRFRLTN